MNRSTLTASGTGRYTVCMPKDQRARPKTRVLVVSEQSLFGEGVEALLRLEPGLEIVGRETDRRQAASRVRETAPDVVVLTDGEAATGLGLELLRLVGEGFHIRIVEIHLETNSLCSYCGGQQAIREVRDLVEAVKHICHSLNREAEVPLSPAI
jgi:DNA-binding NarL/FixJ family response regulator